MYMDILVKVPEGKAGIATLEPIMEPNVGI